MMSREVDFVAEIDHERLIARVAEGGHAAVWGGPPGPRPTPTSASVSPLAAKPDQGSGAAEGTVRAFRVRPTIRDTRPSPFSDAWCANRWPVRKRARHAKACPPHTTGR